MPTHLENYPQFYIGLKNDVFRHYVIHLTTSHDDERFHDVETDLWAVHCKVIPKVIFVMYCIEQDKLLLIDLITV